MAEVLKSWAIPKGPSMHPAEKRLAVMVNDHTLDYGNFEGMIPEGRYGAGLVVIWDQGTYEVLEADDPLAALKSGSLKFSLSGKKLHGAFTMIQLKGPRAIPRLEPPASAGGGPHSGSSRASTASRGTTGKEWLLMKKADRDADPDFLLTAVLTPAKRATLVETIPPCDAA